MKKMSLIAGVVTAAAAATVLWSMPAAADTTDWREAHDRGPIDRDNSSDTSDTDPAATGIPEPGTLALLTLGLGGLGLAALARKRVKA